MSLILNLRFPFGCSLTGFSAPVSTSLSSVLLLIARASAAWAGVSSRRSFSSGVAARASRSATSSEKDGRGLFRATQISSLGQSCAQSADANGKRGVAPSGGLGRRSSITKPFVRRAVPSSHG